MLRGYPRIRWILAHAGGFIPYVAWRLSRPMAKRRALGRLPYGQGVLAREGVVQYPGVVAGNGHKRQGHGGEVTQVLSAQ
jgi:hypothetical protein